MFDKCEMETDFRKDQPTNELTHNLVPLYFDTNIMDKIFVGGFTSHFYLTELKKQLALGSCSSNILLCLGKT